MNVLKGEIAGLLIIEPKVHGDARGFFLETWNRGRYREAGLDVDFVQDNVSFSRRGTLRGLHFQNPIRKANCSRCCKGRSLMWP